MSVKWHNITITPIIFLILDLIRPMNNFLLKEKWLYIIIYIQLGITFQGKLSSSNLPSPRSKSMMPEFEKAVQNLDSATKFGIPRLAYYGMGNFAMTISRVVAQNQLLLKGWLILMMTWNFLSQISSQSNWLETIDFEPAPKGLQHDFHIEVVATTMDARSG